MSELRSSDGVRLAFTDEGDPNGRPVVLIAGFRAPATSWLYQQKPFAAAGHRVISFDRRGHGLSEVTDADPSMRRHGADIGELLDHLDLHDAVLVGGSMGGNAIWSYLSQSPAPRVAGVVIVDQTPKMLNDDTWPFGFYDYSAANEHTYFATSIPDPGRHKPLSKGPVRLARLLKAMSGGTPGREMSAAELTLLNDHAKADWRTTIAAVTVPTLFVAGSESELWPSEHAPAAAELSKHATGIVLEKAGHPTNIEQPHHFNELVLGFLKGLDEIIR